MRGDFLRIIFDIIVLIVLAVLILYIIMVFIGVAMGNELKYTGYLNSIADAINNPSNSGNVGNGKVFINDYDYNYVFVLTNNNGWYLQLYHCLPPNQVVNLFSVKIAYWNVSTTDHGNTVIFAPALAFCKLVKQISLNNINQININIQGLNDNAGLLAYSSNSNNLGILQIFVNIVDHFFPEPSSFILTIVNDTTINCNSNGCTFTSTIYENGNTYPESGNIYCDPNPNANNLPYNASDCVELYGFPENPQIQLSNLEGEIVSSETFTSIIQEFQMKFPLLYFGGSLPPTVMDIEVNSDGGTANINIYIGETVST